MKKRGGFLLAPKLKPIKMKNIRLLLYLTCIGLLFHMCSKQKVEKPVEPISMTQTRLVYDGNNNYVKTLSVIHFHKVTEPEIIKQYKSLPAMQPFCDDMNDTLVTVLGRPCGDENK